MVTRSRNPALRPDAGRYRTGTAPDGHGSRPPRAVPSLALFGLLLALTQGAAGCAMAEVTTSSAATTEIPQTGGSRSETWVTHYHDGHRIVTHDASGTDITVQRGPGSPVSEPDRMPSRYGSERFDPPGMQERFRSGPWGDDIDADTAPGASSATREAFRQRVLDRMYGPPQHW
jgi:hypothetical protein